MFLCAIYVKKWFLWWVIGIRSAFCFYFLMLFTYFCRIDFYCIYVSISFIFFEFYPCGS